MPAGALLRGPLIPGVSAFPQFTSRENAIRLADVLDKGHYRGSQITSVFVKNQGEEEYYLQAILDEGSSRRWTMDNIHDWAKKDDLLLAGNRALIFPVPGSTEFDVLQKNSFYRTVLKASVFHKTYGPHDPLEGRSLLLSIRKFACLVQTMRMSIASTNRGIATGMSLNLKTERASS